VIIDHYSLSDLERKQVVLSWQAQGLQYTRSGYGKKIPTSWMIRLPGSPRWRRLYVCCYSNSGTAYVTVGKDWVTIDY
jgi:hypothetical protein